MGQGILRVIGIFETHEVIDKIIRHLVRTVKAETGFQAQPPALPGIPLGRDCILVQETQFLLDFDRFFFYTFFPKSTFLSVKIACIFPNESGLGWSRAVKAKNS
jgi:hypothetical protein